MSEQYQLLKKRMSELLKKVLTGEKECGKVSKHVSETCDNQEEYPLSPYGRQLVSVNDFLAILVIRC